MMAIVPWLTALAPQAFAPLPPRAPLSGQPVGAAPAPLVYEDRTGGFAQPGLDGGGTEIEFADVDGDGHLDLVSIGDHGSPFVNTSQHGVMVWFGDGQGGWTLFQNGNFGYGGIAVGDANNDGLADVAYGMHHDYSSNDFGDQLLEVALGDGTGMSWTPWDDGLATNGETWGLFATDLADVDNDGWLDVLSNSFGCCAGAHVYRNLGDGTWTQTFGFLGGNANPFALFGDIDGDGNADFAVCNSLGSVWRGDGRGDFVLVDGDLPGTALSRQGLDFGDVDGDGRDEFAYVLGGDLHVSKWISGASWADLSAGLPTGTPFDLVQLEDMDMDGHLDLVAFGGGLVAVFRGDGQGGWSLATGFSVGANGSAVVLRAADVDHNGRPDVAVIQDEPCGFFCSRNKPYFFLETSQPPAAKVELRYPRGGETWVEGSARVVEWQSAIPKGGAGTASIALSTAGPGGPWKTLAAGAPNDGRHQLQVPAGSATENAWLRVTVQAAQATSAQTASPFRIVP